MIGKISDKLEFLESRLFNGRLITSNGCWLFVYSIQINGYARLLYKDREHSVHRLSAHLYLGMPLESTMQVNHMVSCPNKNCFNPEHIYIGTNSQNMLDAVITGNHPNTRKTHCPNGHLYNEENTKWVKDGKSRRCRVCLSIFNKKRDRRKKK